MNDQIKQVLSNFKIDGKLIHVSQNHTGNINKTFVGTFSMSDGTTQNFLFQKINTNVFQEPYKLMHNIDKVTRYIKKELYFNGEDTNRVLEVIRSKDNKNIYAYVNEQGEKEYYRAYNFIENVVSYNTSVSSEVVYNTGKAFGNFQKILKDYPINELEETIPNFHNTEKRFKDFLYDVKVDPNDRAYEVAKEILFVLKRQEDCSLIMNLLKNNRIPLRVCHNDTKVNNVMMDEKTNNFITVVDLDTVMPGSSLFDYGDGVRSAASSAEEDEKDLSKVYINLDYFKAYTDGYLSEMANELCDEEVYNLINGIKIITLELGMRFLNDYINGDTYFKTDYENQNLYRARNQFHLVEDIELKYDVMQEYVLESYQNHRENHKAIIKKL